MNRYFFIALRSTVCGLLLIEAAGCKTTTNVRQVFQVSGRRLAMHFIISYRMPRIAGSVDGSQAFADSLDGTILLTRVAGDSIFGSFELDIGRLGIRGGSASGQQVFSGLARDSSVDIHLFADATDAGIEMRGIFRDSQVAGTWKTDQGSDQGRFQLDTAP